MTFIYGPEHVCGAAILLGWGLLALVEGLGRAVNGRRLRRQGR